MKYCLIGEKLSHSYSKIIHESLGINYELKEIQRSEIEHFCKNLKYDGFNITIPYKQCVFDYLYFISDTAKKIGAVNTVLNKNGKLYGYNTDYEGILYSFKKLGVNLQGKTVLILGTGGASKSVKAVCEDLGAKVLLAGRNSQINYQNCYDYEPQIIVNATPVGMFPNAGESPIDLYKFKGVEAVLDCIYNPLKTKFIQDAEELNIKNLNGLTMLVRQALVAIEIWTGEKCTDCKTEEVLNDLTKKTLNIVLVGMPSCGKTTIGKILAEKLNKNYVDLDEYITQKYQKSPAQIINESGEQLFREIESATIMELSTKSNLVLATGGGVILRNENIKNLKSNGEIVYIKRDLDKLLIENRPISQKVGVENLYKTRKPLYENCANFIVDNNGALEKTVKEIVNFYENISY